MRDQRPLVVFAEPVPVWSVDLRRRLREHGVEVYGITFARDLMSSNSLLLTSSFWTTATQRIRESLGSTGYKETGSRCDAEVTLCRADGARIRVTLSESMGVAPDGSPVIDVLHDLPGRPMDEPSDGARGVPIV